jgi:hypothetical protein
MPNSEIPIRPRPFKACVDAMAEKQVVEDTLYRLWTVHYSAVKLVHKILVAARQAQHFTDPYRSKGHNTQDLFYSEAEFNDFVALAKIRSKEEEAETLKNAKTLLDYISQAISAAEKNGEEIQNEISLR